MAITEYSTPPTAGRHRASEPDVPNLRHAFPRRGHALPVGALLAAPSSDLLIFTVLQFLGAPRIESLEFDFAMSPPATHMHLQRICTLQIAKPAPANSLITSMLATISAKAPYPPPPPYFAMCMQIKHLQRSVVDVYANKGLIRKIVAGAQFASRRFWSGGYLEAGRV
jgi:hypothetical protein